MRRRNLFYLLLAGPAWGLQPTTSNNKASRSGADRGKRRRQSRNGPRDCRNRSGFHFSRRAHAFRARGGYWTRF